MVEPHRKGDGWALIGLVLLACSSCSMLFPAATEVLGDDQDAFWLAVGADIEGLFESLLWIMGMIGL